MCEGKKTRSAHGRLQKEPESCRSSRARQSTAHTRTDTESAREPPQHRRARRSGCRTRQGWVKPLTHTRHEAQQHNHLQQPGRGQRGRQARSRPPPTEAGRSAGQAEMPETADLAKQIRVISGARSAASLALSLQPPTRPSPPAPPALTGIPPGPLPPGSVPPPPPQGPRGRPAPPFMGRPRPQPRSHAHPITTPITS